MTRLRVLTTMSMKLIQAPIKEKKMRIILMIVFAALNLPTVSFAEIIHLRDGRTVNEKIIERGGYYIVTTDGTMPKKYFEGEYTLIEEDPIQDTSVQADVDMLKFPGMDESKVKLVLAMVEASGVRQNMETNIDQILSRVDADKVEKFKELFSVKDIIDRLVPVYGRYYTEEELVDIIKFYESSPGRKVVASTPRIMEETVQKTMEYVQEKMSPR